jgi:hypothetical protein
MQSEPCALAASTSRSISSLQIEREMEDTVTSFYTNKMIMQVNSLPH